MGAFIPFIIWLISAFIYDYLARKRHVRLNTWRILIVVFLGPLAIPLVYLFKPDPHYEKRAG